MDVERRQVHAVNTLLLGEERVIAFDEPWHYARATDLELPARRPAADAAGSTPCSCCCSSSSSSTSAERRPEIRAPRWMQATPRTPTSRWCLMPSKGITDSRTRTSRATTSWNRPGRCRCGYKWDTAPAHEGHEDVRCILIGRSCFLVCASSAHAHTSWRGGEGRNALCCWCSGPQGLRRRDGQAVHAPMSSTRSTLRWPGRRQHPPVAWGGPQRTRGTKVEQNPPLIVIDGRAWTSPVMLHPWPSTLEHFGEGFNCSWHVLR